MARLSLAAFCFAVALACVANKASLLLFIEKFFALSSTPFGLGLVVDSLTWLTGAWLATLLLNRFFWDGLVAPIARRSVPKLLKSAFAVIIFICAISGILSFVFGKSVTAIWATSGVLGIVLGLALRNMIQDVFTGIALNLDSSIRENDWIALHHRDFNLEQYGKVLNIGWRTTRIQLENNNVVVVPNGMMGMMAVTNFAHSDHVSRLQTEIVIDFDVPVERARRILLAGARAAAVEKGILQEPEPVVVVGEPVERGVNYKVRFWGNVAKRSPSSLQDAVMTHLLKHLNVSGLSPALPKEDVFVERRPRRLLDHARLEDRIEILSRCDLFAQSLEQPEIEELAANILVLEFEAGDVVVSEGSPGASMFVLSEGVLAASLSQRPDQESDETTHKSDKGLVVGHIAAGGVFGEMSLLTGERRSATITALTGVLVYEVTFETFEAILERRPAIGEAVSKLVAERQIATKRAVDANAFRDMETEKHALTDLISSKMKAVFSGVFGRSSAA